VPIVFEKFGGVERRPFAAFRITPGRKVFVNVGSVGQPRDGDPRASALVLDTEARRASWFRVHYPIREVQADIRAAGLPAWLADRLATGD
jgi:diadenosine tetraphosphatase ApaH/serine/threonine PP2A family protein phosphatase